MTSCQSLTVKYIEETVARGKSATIQSVGSLHIIHMTSAVRGGWVTTKEDEAREVARNQYCISLQNADKGGVGPKSR